MRCPYCETINEPKETRCIDCGRKLPLPGWFREPQKLRNLVAKINKMLKGNLPSDAEGKNLYYFFEGIDGDDVEIRVITGGCGK